MHFRGTASAPQGLERCRATLKWQLGSGSLCRPVPLYLPVSLLSGRPVCFLTSRCPHKGRHLEGTPYLLTWSDSLHFALLSMSQCYICIYKLRLKEFKTGPWISVTFGLTAKFQKLRVRNLGQTWGRVAELAVGLRLAGCSSGSLQGPTEGPAGPHMVVVHTLMSSSGPL